MPFHVTGASGKYLLIGIVESEFAFVHEHHYRHRGELLAYGPRLEDGLGLRGHVEFDVGEAVAHRAHDLAIAADRQRDSRNLVALHLAQQKLVDSVGERDGGKGE